MHIQSIMIFVFSKKQSGNVISFSNPKKSFNIIPFEIQKPRFDSKSQQLAIIETIITTIVIMHIYGPMSPIYYIQYLYIHDLMYE